MDTTRLAGKNILITGAAQGMGAAVAIDYAAQGANVCLGDVNVDGAPDLLLSLHRLSRVLLNQGATDCGTKRRWENKPVCRAAHQVGCGAEFAVAAEGKLEALSRAGRKSTPGTATPLIPIGMWTEMVAGPFNPSPRRISN